MTVLVRDDVWVRSEDSGERNKGEARSTEEESPAVLLFVGSAHSEAVGRVKQPHSSDEGTETLTDEKTQGEYRASI